MVGGNRRASNDMANIFGFTDEEIKLLLVAVRHMRRTFQQAQKAGSASPIDPYFTLYDALYDKLRDMAGPLPEGAEELME
jgi:hypothetical protein